MNETPFQSGAIRLPPREFLKRLPVRISHLVFEIASEDKNNQLWMEMKMKLFELSGCCKLPEKKHEPLYFIKMEHGEEFQYCNTNYYFEDFTLPMGAVWVVRFEEHIHFVSFSFHRYFESSCTSIANGEAGDLAMFRFHVDSLDCQHGKA